MSFYRATDIEQLAERLRAAGHKLELNLARGTHLLDNLIADDSSPWELCIRQESCGHVITSVGLIVQKV